MSVDILDAILTLLGGVVLGWGTAWLKTRAEIRRATNESTVTLAKLRPELAALAIETVEKANAALRTDNDIIRGERDYYRSRLNEALVQLDEVSEDLRKAQAITSKLQAQITTLLNQGLSEVGE